MRNAHAHALWSLFAAVLLLVVAPGCGAIAKPDRPAEDHVTIDFRSEKKDGKEVGLPWLEPAIPATEARAMVAGFDWNKTTPLRELDADGAPALYYGVVYIVNRAERDLLDQAGLHHSTMPMFEPEMAKWHGLKGKVPQSNDGRGALVFTVIPGRLYNLIRQYAIAGDPLFSAIVLRDIPAPARNAEGSLSYDQLLRAHFKYRGMEPIRPGNVGTTQQKLVILAAREALKVIAEAAEEVARAIALAAGNRDRDGLLFGFGAAGTARLHLNLQLHDTDPAFGGARMTRAWGVHGGEPVMLPGVRVSVWSRGDSTVLWLTTLFEGTTDGGSSVTLDLAKDRPVRQLCIATENDAAEITDFLTEIEVCDFEGSVDKNIDYLKASDTYATVSITDTYFNILAQATEGSAYLHDIVGYSPHKAEIVVGWIADAMGFFGTGAPFTPCLGFPNVTADILVADILSLVALIPVVGPVLAITLGAATPLLAADMFFPDSDALRSRGAPTHEYGHFATCSVLYDQDPTNISTVWTGAVEQRIGSGAVPGTNDSMAYDIEAVADFFAGQMVGGTNYFQPGTITSGIMSYCDAEAPNPANCLERNYSSQSDFFQQVARVATTMHDAFDGAFNASQPGYGNDWTLSNGVVVWDGAAFNGNGYDEVVHLPGHAIKDFLGKLDTMAETKFMSSLASTIRDNGYNWCQACRVFSLHAGVAASAPDADHYAACAADPIKSWLGGPVPDSSLPGSCNFTRCPDPLVLSGDQTCVPCPAGQIAVDGIKCLQCPAGTQVVDNQCQNCIGRVCTPACPDRQEMVNGVCTDCPFSDVSVNGKCTACPTGQYRNDNTCVDTCPPPPVGWILTIDNGVCEYGIL